MSVEEVRVTGHIRDLIVSRLDPDVRAAFHRASAKAWKASIKGVHVSFTDDEINAVELVEQKFLLTMNHRRHKRTKTHLAWV